MQREKSQIISGFQPVNGPPIGFSGSEAISQNRFNLDSLAEIAAFVETLRFHLLGRNRLGRFRGGTGFFFATTATACLTLIKFLPIRVQTQIAKHL